MATPDGLDQPGSLARSRRLLPPFAALRAFEAVGHLGGIRKAALELGVDHAAVSRHLRTLEAWAGVKLVERSQGGRLTAEGAAFHARISAAIDDICQASAELTRRGEDRRLLIWCVPGFAYCWLNDRLGDFIRANPEIDLEVRPSDSEPDFSRHAADADIRYLAHDAPPAPDLMSEEIARPVVFPVAAPSVVATLGDAPHPHDLLRATLLHEADDAFWRTWFAAQNVPTPERLAGPRLWHAHLTLQAARRGQGVALTNPLLWSDKASDDLVRVPLHPEPTDLSLATYVFRARRDRWRNPAILRFRRWLLKAAAQAETPQLR